ncbi:hypothetical protein HDV04_005686 [Boothiomyces sp. JEL0838]|nr:hypothetical protein HDV04_005686 [Boothiomyces sp. JEL0838]
MRDNKKRCGMTIHQNIEQTDKLGSTCPEYPFKEKERKKSKYPPNEFNGKMYLGSPEDPEIVCVDILVDGKRSPGWILKSGRQNGVCVDKVFYRGQDCLFEFGGSNSDQPVELIIMKIGGDEFDEEAREDYIPDEGMPAVAILTFYYKTASLLQNMPKKKAHGLNSELSTCLSSPVVQSKNKYSFDFIEYEEPSKIDFDFEMKDTFTSGPLDMEVDEKENMFARPEPVIKDHVDSKKESTKLGESVESVLKPPTHVFKDSVKKPFANVQTNCAPPVNKSLLDVLAETAIMTSSFKDQNGNKVISPPEKVKPSRILKELKTPFRKRVNLRIYQDKNQYSTFRITVDKSTLCEKRINHCIESVFKSKNENLERYKVVWYGADKSMKEISDITTDSYSDIRQIRAIKC